MAIIKEEVDSATAMLLTVVNQAMAHGLFNNIEDMPKLLDAIKLNQRLYDELHNCRIQLQVIVNEVNEP